MTNNNPSAPLIPGTSIYNQLELSLTEINELLDTNPVICNEITAKTITDSIAYINEGVSYFLSPTTDSINSTLATVDYVINKTGIIPTSNNVIGSIQYNNNGQFSGDENLTTSDNTINISGILWTSNIINDSLSIGTIGLMSPNYSLAPITNINISPYTITFFDTLGLSGQIIAVSNSTLIWTSHINSSGLDGYIQYSDINQTFSSSSLLQFDESTNTLISDASNTSVLDTTNLGITDSISISAITGTLGSVTIKPHTNSSVYSLTTPLIGITSQIISSDSGGNLYWNNNTYNTSEIPSIIYNDNNLISYTTDFSLINGKVNVTNKLEQNTNKLEYISHFIPLGFSDISCINIFNDSIYLSRSELYLYNTSGNQITANTNVNITKFIYQGSYVYGINNNTLYIFDTNTLNIINSISFGIYGPLPNNSMYLEGCILYICGYNSFASFLIYDVSNINDIRLLGYLDSSVIPNPTDIFVENGFAYISCANNIFSFVIIDISDLHNPIKVSSLELNGCYSVCVSGTYAYLGGTYFTIVNIYDKENPKIEGNIINITNGKINNIYLSRLTCFASQYNTNELLIIDVEDVKNPLIVYSYTNGNIYNINDIRICGNKMYCAALNRIVLVDIYGSKFEMSDIGNIKANNINVNNTLKIQGPITSNNLIADKMFVSNLFISSETVTINNIYPLTSALINSRNGIIIISNCVINAGEEKGFIVYNNYCISNSKIFVDINNFGYIGFPVVAVKSVNEGNFEILIKNVSNDDMNNELKITYLIF